MKKVEVFWLLIAKPSLHSISN